MRACWLGETEVLAPAISTQDSTFHYLLPPAAMLRAPLILSLILTEFRACLFRQIQVPRENTSTFFPNSWSSGSSTCVPSRRFLLVCWDAPWHPGRSPVCLSPGKSLLMTFQESIFLFLEAIVHRARESVQDSQAPAESSGASRDARSCTLGLINTIQSQQSLKQKGI